MEHAYIIVADGMAFQVVIVSNDIIGGRYQILSLAYCGIKDGGYDSISEIEAQFDIWVANKIIDAWYPLWHPGLQSMDTEKYSQKVKRIMRMTH